MKRNMIKTVSAVLASAMILSMTGCSQESSDRDKKERETTEEETTVEDSSEDVLEATEDLCKAIADADMRAVSDLATDEERDQIAGAEGVFDFSGGMYSDDMAAYLEAVTGTIEYEIDEDSLDIDEDKGTAEIDISFSEYDLASNTMIGCLTIDDVVAEAENGPTTTYEYTLELENTDDGWKVTGITRILDEVYFYVMIASMMPGARWDPASSSFTTAEEGTNEWGQTATTDYEFDGPSYINCRDVDFDSATAFADAEQNMFAINMCFSTDSEDTYADLTGYYGTVELDGETILTISGDSQFTIMADASTGTIATGEYTFNYYAPDGSTVWTGMVIVE